MNILRELLCIWSDWKSLNGLSFLEDIYINFRKMEVVEISWLPHVWIHGSLHIQECRDQSEIYKEQRIQLLNNKFINGYFLGGMLDQLVDCKTCARTLCVQQNLNNKIKFQPCSAFSSEKRMNQGKTQCWVLFVISKATFTKTAIKTTFTHRFF